MDNRIRRDLFALGLLVLTAFLAISLFTYDKADPLSDWTGPFKQLHQPRQLVHPLNEEIANAGGWAGAHAADMLLCCFGIGAYYLVASLAVLDVLLLLRRQVTALITRLLGWTLTLIAFTTLISMCVRHWTPGPMSGPGGFLGLLGESVLTSHFGLIGGVLLTFSLLAAGLLLCTDYVLVRLGIVAAMIGLNMMTTMRAGGLGRLASLGSIRSKLRRVDAGNDDEEAIGKDEGQLPIRIGGRKIDLRDEEDELEEDEPYAEEEEYEYEDEEAEAEEEEQTVKEPVAAAALVEQETKPRFKPHRPPKKKKSDPDDAERERVIEQLEEASLLEEAGEYDLPKIKMLFQTESFSYEEQEAEVRRKAKILRQTFKDFGHDVRVVEIETGPVIAQYEVQLAAGLKLSKITGLADDLAIALRVPSVRIVAPIPGKNTVGIEVPNAERQVVRLREVMEETNDRVKKMRIPLFLGKDVSGNALTADLSTLPHLLIAGRTGTGKSVCLNAIIASILMTRRPDEVRMLMIDPKMVELSGYKTLPHLMHPVVTDMRKAEAILAWAVDKMEERYALLAQANVRHIAGYNQLTEEELIDRIQPETEEQKTTIPLHLPYIVIVADEMADLMMTSGKEVEQHIIRLAQKSRAVGIHLILATQKPTVDVITGLIKSNLPARIAFQVASRTDSRVVLDEMGAEKLLGNGDMLFLWPGTSTLLRGQGTYLEDEEINSIVDWCSSNGEQHFVNELVQMKVEDPQDGGEPGKLKNRDELYESAVDIVIREQRGSVSLLQRSLGIGYGRAARLIDFMEQDRIVGPYNGSQAREVIMSAAEWAAVQGLESEEGTAEPATEMARSVRIAPEDDASDLDDETDAQASDEDDGDEYEDEHEDAADEYEEDEYEEADDDEEAEYEDDEYEYEDDDEFEPDEYEAESA